MLETSKLHKRRAIEAFLMGAGSVWCIFPLVQQPARFTFTWGSDADAIESDWRAVGLDLIAAMQDAAIYPYAKSR